MSVLPRAGKSLLSFSFSKLVLQFELNIFFILEDIETNCSVMLPGEDDMDDGMPELEDYDDVVANILMVNGLLMVDGQPQDAGHCTCIQ